MCRCELLQWHICRFYVTVITVTGEKKIMALVNVKFLDFSDEASAVSFNVADPSGATYDWDALETAIGVVTSAIEAVSLCTRSTEQISVKTDLGSAARPADEEAQREQGLRVFYMDNTTQKKYHLTIPGPEVALMASPGFDVVDWSGSEMAALETALEAGILSPVGNAISILTGKIVGRNN
jgi:hypothetical protein